MVDKDVDAILHECRGQYPTILTIKQAAEIAQVPLNTIYEWSSRGLLNAFKSKRGRHVRLGRDAFLRWYLQSEDAATVTV